MIDAMRNMVIEFKRDIDLVVSSDVVDGSPVLEPRGDEVGTTTDERQRAAPIAAPVQLTSTAAEEPVRETTLAKNTIFRHCELRTYQAMEHGIAAVAVEVSPGRDQPSRLDRIKGHPRTARERGAYLSSDLFFFVCCRHM